MELPDFDSWWDYNDPAATEEKFNSLLPQAQGSGDLEYQLELQTQIARTLGLQQKFTEAHALLDVVESQLTASTLVAAIRYRLERGRSLNSHGERDSSVSFFLEAWELGKKAGTDFHAVDAAHMLGIVTPTEEQLEWNEEAMAIAEVSDDPRARNWLGSLYNNIGWTYHGMDDFHRSLELFEKALAWREEKGQERETQIAKWCVARAHRSLGNLEQSLEMQLELAEEMEVQDQAPDGYVHEEIAECLLAMDRGEESKSHFKQAYALLSQDIWMVKNEVERLERLKELGGNQQLY